jgi:hypothetical protein
MEDSNEDSRSLVSNWSLRRRYGQRNFISPGGFWGGKYALDLDANVI